MPQQRNVNYWMVPSFSELNGVVDTLGTGVCTYVAPTPGKQLIYLFLSSLSSFMYGPVMCESESGFGFESGFKAFWAGFGFRPQKA